MVGHRVGGAMSAGGSMKSDLFRLIRLFRKCKSRSGTGPDWRTPGTASLTWGDVEVRNERKIRKKVIGGPGAVKLEGRTPHSALTGRKGTSGISWRRAAGSSGSPAPGTGPASGILILTSVDRSLAPLSE